MQKFVYCIRLTNLTDFLKTFSRCLLSLLFVAAIPATSADDSIRLIAIGDSLIAGHGLPVEDGFVTQLETALVQNSHDVRVFNGGVTGDTTDGGLARIDWILSDPYSAVILHLGHNDAFRAIPVPIVQQNLDQMMSNIQARNLPILLAGAMAPRNLGPEYYRAFDAVFPELADKYNVVFYPFFLAGVATDPSLNQADGIHPNQSGVALIVQQILPYVEELLEQVKQQESN